MRIALGLAAAAAVACASARAPSPSPPADRTDDPEFVAALEAAERQFETQADALAAGVYEPFVHPDSVRPGPSETPVSTPFVESPAVDFGPDDPSTAELLGTLPAPGQYNPPGETPLGAPADPSTAGTAWTLQVGAFDAETGALVRLRQLERDFPDWPHWHVAEAGLFRVYVGRFTDRAAAVRARVELGDRGYGDAWIVQAP
jgi:cell division septation protein DedD